MRLASLSVEQLDDQQSALYRTITGGPRAQGRQLFPLKDDNGSLTGPFGIMLHLPALGAPLQELGSAIRYQTGLSARIREIAILSVAAATDSAFERYAHERVGRSVGLTDSELNELANGKFSGGDAVEAAAYHFCLRLIGNDLPLPDADYDALRQTLGEVALIELTTLVGYYRTLAQLLHVFDVGLPNSVTS